MASMSNIHDLIRVVNVISRVEKGISLRTLRIIHHIVGQGPCDGLSTRTSRTSGQRNCRLEKRTCRVEKCISLRTLGKYTSSCKARALRWVVDSYESYEWTTLLSTRRGVVVEWRNASH